MRQFASILAIVAICLSFVTLSQAEIVIDDRYYEKINTKHEALEQGDYDIIYASRDAVLKDMTVLDEASGKIQQFKQSNDRSYGLPSGVDELEQILNRAKAFSNKDLQDAKSLSKSLMKKYNVSSLQELGNLAGKIINPGGQIAPVTVPSGYSFLERNIQWVEEFVPQIETALSESKQQAEETSAKLNKPKNLTNFPKDSYSGGDLRNIKVQMLNALTGSIIKGKDEVLNISVTSDWDKGIFSDTKLPYRKIKGTLLFADDDGDGASRFTSYSFISTKVDDEWQPLKYKGFDASLEGWTTPVKGSLGASAGKGFLGTLIWLLLAAVNILAGLMACEAILKGRVSAVEKVIQSLHTFSVSIGLIALGTGILSFILSLLSLQILSDIIPQATAVLLGLSLSSDFIKG
jgi:hypothetical protein